MLPGLLPIHNTLSGPVNATYVASGGVIGSGVTTATHSSANFGTDPGNRMILAAITWDGTPPASLLSATIGGVAVTIIGQAHTGGDFYTAWIVASPSGASGNIVCNFASSAAQITSDVWSITGGFGVFTFQSSTTTSVTGVIRLADGAVFGVIRHGTSGSGVTWTNIATKDSDAATSGDRYSSAHENTSAGSTVTVTAASNAGQMSVVTVH